MWQSLANLNILKLHHKSQQYVGTEECILSVNKTEFFMIKLTLKHSIHHYSEYFEIKHNMPTVHALTQQLVRIDIYLHALGPVTLLICFSKYSIKFTLSNFNGPFHSLLWIELNRSVGVKRLDLHWIKVKVL